MVSYQEMRFLKVRNVKSPVRKNGDAGIDFFVPEKSDKFIEDLKSKNDSLIIDNDEILLAPNHSVLIPSGIKSRFNSNIALVAMNKSGIATKYNLIVGASVIDSSYTGEIHIHVMNAGYNTVRIPFGMKLVQFVPLVINDNNICVCEDMTEEEFYHDFSSSRGDGGFGSTGEK